MMIWILTTIVLIVLALLIRKIGQAHISKMDQNIGRIVVLTLGIGLGAVLVVQGTAITTGAMPNYGEGTTFGVIVDIQRSGMMFATNECIIQESVNHRQTVSVTSPEVIRQIIDTWGKPVQVRYRRWLIAPVRSMGTNIEVLSVLLLKKDRK